MPVQVVYLTAVLLLLGLFPFNDDFFAFLKITASGTFAWGAYRNFGKKKVLLPLVYSLFTILFNPVIDIHLAKEIWMVADLAGAILLFFTREHIVE